jgi:antibiotic biosynthesis monooxygenase (ABM) superfamily enzyme
MDGMGTPVTVAVRRQTMPARSGDAVAWVEEGLRLARGFDGCLGGGVLRDSGDENVLHAIYRFADEAALGDWERSEQRRRWLEAGSPLVLDARVGRSCGAASTCERVTRAPWWCARRRSAGSRRWPSGWACTR